MAWEEYAFRAYELTLLWDEDRDATIRSFLKNRDVPVDELSADDIRRMAEHYVDRRLTTIREERRQEAAANGAGLTETWRHTTDEERKLLTVARKAHLEVRPWRVPEAAVEQARKLLRGAPQDAGDGQRRLMLSLLLGADWALKDELVDFALRMGGADEDRPVRTHAERRFDHWQWIFMSANPELSRVAWSRVCSGEAAAQAPSMMYWLIKSPSASMYEDAWPEGLASVLDCMTPEQVLALISRTRNRLAQVAPQLRESIFDPAVAWEMRLALLQVFRYDFETVKRIFKEGDNPELRLAYLEANLKPGRDFQPAILNYLQMAKNTSLPIEERRAAVRLMRKNQEGAWLKKVAQDDELEDELRDQAAGALQDLQEKDLAREAERKRQEEERFRVDPEMGWEMVLGSDQSVRSAVENPRLATEGRFTYANLFRGQFAGLGAHCIYRRWRAQRNGEEPPPRPSWTDDASQQQLRYRIATIPLAISGELKSASDLVVAVGMWPMIDAREGKVTYWPTWIVIFADGGYQQCFGTDLADQWPRFNAARIANALPPVPMPDFPAEALLEGLGIDTTPAAGSPASTQPATPEH